MAQWKGMMPPNDERRQFLAQQALGSSGPASPMRATNNAMAPLAWSIPFEVDVDADVSTLYDTDPSAKSPTPQTCTGSSRKRPHDEVAGAAAEGEESEGGGQLLVPTPTKPSPPGTARCQMPERPASLTLSRRIFFSTPPLGGRPGSGLSIYSSDGAKPASTDSATTPSNATSAAARAASPFGKCKRSASPFSAIKPPPCGVDTLKNINLMVNRAAAASRGRPRSVALAGRSGAPSPAPSCSARSRSRPNTPYASEGGSSSLTLGRGTSPSPLHMQHPQLGPPQASIQQLFCPQLHSMGAPPPPGARGSGARNTVRNGGSALRTSSSLSGAAGGGSGGSGGGGSGTPATVQGEATGTPPAKRGRGRPPGSGRGRGRPPKKAYLPNGQLMSFAQYTAMQQGLPIPAA